MHTLQSIVEHRMWCCSLDVAVLAVLGCALARLSPFHPLRLRFVASARDQGDEGLSQGFGWVFVVNLTKLEVRSACLTNMFQSTSSNPLEILSQATIPKSPTDSPVLLSYCCHIFMIVLLL